jgi:amino acid adenylation domain-containing protein
VPAAYVRLERLPLTPSGKVDRRALPAPETDAYAGARFEEPQGETEQALAEIWAELLKVERVGRHDNFFNLGGHSLLAVHLLERLKSRGWVLSIGDLFETQVLSVLASKVKRDEAEDAIPTYTLPASCQRITPDMIPLTSLDQSAIDEIVSSIPGGVRNIQDIYPLTPLQEGIVYHHLTTSRSDPFLVSILYEFDRRDDMQKYLDGLQSCIDRHDVLRSSVFWEGLPEPVQVVWRTARLEVTDLALEDSGNDVIELLYEAARYQEIRLDIRAAPLMRVWRAHDPRNGRWLLLQVMHQLVGDHSSLERLREEIEVHMEESAAPLPPPIPFRNFVARVRHTSKEVDHKAYFTRELGDVDEPTLMFGVSGVVSGREWSHTQLPVDSAIATRIRAQAKRFGVSPASIFHVAWALVTAHAASKADVVFGTVLFGDLTGVRSTAGSAIGLHINMLPIRIVVDDTEVASAIKDVHRKLGELILHENASLTLAQRCSRVSPPSALLTSLLNFRHSEHVTTQAADRCETARGMARALRSDERSTYPVTVSVDDLGEGFVLSAHVQQPIDPTRVCGLTLAAVSAIVDALERDSAATLRALDVLPRAERTRVLEGFGANPRENPECECIHQLFERQVRNRPEGIALVDGKNRVTYRELNERANRLAWELVEMGIRPEDRVAVYLDRGVQMIVSVLAILKAGAAYVPLDPGYPLERLQFMIADCEPKVMLTERPLQEVVPPGSAVEVVVLDSHDVEEHRLNRRTENLNVRAVGLTARSLAYVIYTSGSTGVPKGVMVEHEGLYNLALSLGPLFGVTSESRVLQFSSFSFDGSTWDWMMALTYGASLYFETREGLYPGRSLRDTITRHDITHVTMVASAAAATFVDDGIPDGLALIVTGEPCAPALAKAGSCGGRLFNVYGPTETTICTTTYQCGCENGTPVVPVGKPMPNTRVYVLNDRLQPVSVGVVGEIYIGGMGVSRGYWNREDLTREKFLSDVFAGPGERMYKTGDLGRWRVDGTLEYLGRADDQVKIRGFRIELGEVESALVRCPGVKDAVVVAFQRPEAVEQVLVAYYTVKDESKNIDARDLSAVIRRVLPEYMVPSAYVRLERLPLTPNGKVDRLALPVPDTDAYPRAMLEEPQGETEQTLAEIWAELLKVERISRHDNFFNLGGHSLLAVRVITAIGRRFDLELAVHDLFQYPVLRDLAEKIECALLESFDTEDLRDVMNALRTR